MNTPLIAIVVLERQIRKKEVVEMTREVAKASKGIHETIDEILGELVDIPKEGLDRKEAILAILSRAADEPEFLSRLADDPHEALKEYYSLTWEERAALASGDIKKIESWVGKLDKRLATWLWCRLSQEKW